MTEAIVVHEDYSIQQLLEVERSHVMAAGGLMSQLSPCVLRM